VLRKLRDDSAMQCSEQMAGSPVAVKDCSL